MRWWILLGFRAIHSPVMLVLHGASSSPTHIRHTNSSANTCKVCEATHVAHREPPTLLKNPNPNSKIKKYWASLDFAASGRVCTLNLSCSCVVSPCWITVSFWSVLKIVTEQVWVWVMGRLASPYLGSLSRAFFVQFLSFCWCWDIFSSSSSSTFCIKKKCKTHL